MRYLVPALMDNIDSLNSDLRVESLKVLSELSSLIFNKQNDIATEDIRKELRSIIEGQFIDL